MRVAALLLFAAALVGCAGLPTPFGDQGERGASIRFTDVSIDDAGTTLSLRFVGAAEFDADNPCSAAYAATAAIENEDTLAVEVYQVVFDVNKPREGTFCTLEGYDRGLSLALEPPFHGSRIRDLGGDQFLFVRPPLGLWELTTLPTGWELQRAEDVEDSPNGRWLRIYASNAADATVPRSRLELYQAFQHDVGVTGGDEITKVEVNGTSATLYRYAPEGELVLTWMVGGNGFAMVAYEDMFSIDALITLAETMRPPDAH